MKLVLTAMMLIALLFVVYILATVVLQRLGPVVLP